MGGHHHGARAADAHRTWRLGGVRTGEGRERAKRRGVKLGRKPKLTLEQRREAMKRRNEGEETRTEIARRYNVHPSTISRLTA
jgi:DNA invertase Pin-like site-specific DNA recombinase